MSVIRKKPFIEMVIDSLSPAMKDALAGVLNNQPATINRDSSFADMPSGNTVTAVYFKLDETNFKNGILIYNNSYCVLVAYHRFQDLLIYQLNVAAKQYEKINEYLDINELRRVLNDRVGKDIDAGEIDSGSATTGQVLAADGAGGAEWVDSLDTITPETVQAGDAVQLFGFDASGNLVKDDMPEGITVDQSVIEDSTNAVAGGAVYDELQNHYTKTEVDGLLENKANVDGNYPTMTVGVADQLSPYDDESGDDQDEPFSFQATGTGNGSQPDFSTGAIALMKEKQGHSVAVNQFAKALNTSNWGIYGATGSITDGIVSMTATEQYGSCVQVNVPVIANHKYFMSCDMFLTSDTNDVSLNLYYADKALKPLTSGWHHLQDIVTVSTSANVDFRVIDNRASGWDEIKAKNIILIDLTQWFGSNDAIPSDLLSHPEDFFRYYQGSLAYNTGELVNANGRYIKCIGRQQWDEEWELGTIDTTTGVVGSGSNILSKNYIKVIPNVDYAFKQPYGITTRVFFYDKDKNFVNSPDLIYTYQAYTVITIPSNVCYIKFQTNYSTYNNDITISLYYEDESGYDQYYPYEVLTNNDTGTEVLRSAGSVKDYKTPDGTIHRLVGVVDLGTLSWNYSNSKSCWYANLNLAKVENSNPQMISEKYKVKNANLWDSDANGIATSSLLGTGYNAVICRNGSSTTEPSGTLYYELAEPTTEQGTPFSENLVIDDFGSMEFAGTNGVPQGNLIFYPVDYKAFIDTLYDYTEGTPSNIALKSDLPTAPQTWAESLPGYDATKTQTLKNVEGTLTWVDDE